MIAVAIYASLSRKKTRRDKDDTRDEESVESQVAKVRNRLDVVYADGYRLVGVFHKDVGYSGSKRNRGPDLERAIAAVTRAAETGDHEAVELWSNTSARFARGPASATRPAPSASSTTTYAGAASPCAPSRTTSSSRTRCWSASPAPRPRSTPRTSASRSQGPSSGRPATASTSAARSPSAT